MLFVEYVLNAAVIVIGIPFYEDFMNPDSDAYNELVTAFLEQVRASIHSVFIAIIAGAMRQRSITNIEALRID